MQRFEVSGAVRPLYGSLGVKGLIVYSSSFIHFFDKPCKGYCISGELLKYCAVDQYFQIMWSRRREFDPGPFHVAFILEKVLAVQGVFFPANALFSCQYYCTSAQFT